MYDIDAIFISFLNIIIPTSWPIPMILEFANTIWLSDNLFLCCIYIAAIQYRSNELQYYTNPKNDKLRF